MSGCDSVSDNASFAPFTPGMTHRQASGQFFLYVAPPQPPLLRHWQQQALGIRLKKETRRKASHHEHSTPGSAVHAQSVRGLPQFGQHLRPTKSADPHPLPPPAATGSNYLQSESSSQPPATPAPARARMPAPAWLTLLLAAPPTKLRPGFCAGGDRNTASALQVLHRR